MKTVINNALKKSNGDLDKFKSELKKSDIDFKVNHNESGRATGALFTSGNKTWPGSKIDRQFSVGNLQKSGLNLGQQNNKSPFIRESEPSQPVSSGGGGGGSIVTGGDGVDSERRNRTANFTNNVAKQNRERER